MLKFRKPQNIRIKQEEIEETNKSQLEMEEEKKENVSINNGKKRIKERVIGDVIQKVVQWRQMHEGIEENGKKVQKRTNNLLSSIPKMKMLNTI